MQKLSLNIWGTRTPKGWHSVYATIWHLMGLSRTDMCIYTDNMGITQQAQDMQVPPKVSEVGKTSEH